MENNTKKFNIGFILFVAIATLALGYFWSALNIKEMSKPRTYSEIIGYFREDKVKDYKMNSGSGEIEITLKEGQKIRYSVPSLEWFREDTKDYVKKHNDSESEEKISYDIVPGFKYWPVIKDIGIQIFMIVLAGVFIFMLLRRFMPDVIDNMRPGGDFGKTKFRDMSKVGRKTTFDDVAGAKEEKEELQEIVEFLKNPNKFNSLGARIPKGVLLVGPPGTGKTLLARAVSGEANVPFFSISGSDFVELYVGVGASRVRSLFEEAKKNTPCIVFIDEIDAIGREREMGPGGSQAEREQTLNQLLVEMDGFGENAGVIIIAATNRPDVLDKALLRPGRFDRQIAVNYPDVKGRLDILKVHAKEKPFAPDVNLETVAKSTSGFTGADLENLLNEAALLAAREQLMAITTDQIQKATIKVVMGTEKKSKVMSDKEKRITAVHECGHAIVTYFCKTADPVHQISIIPTGLAGGYTMSLPTEEKSYQSSTEMKESVMVLLGGRVAEKLVLDDISTGASNDIERATSIVRSMVTKYGMSEKLGPIAYSTEKDDGYLFKEIAKSKNISERVASEIDDEIKRIMDECYQATHEIVKNNVPVLNRVADFLLEKEKITGEEFMKIMEECC